jgi:DNA-binding beta-propeller fold protein YncE
MVRISRRPSQQATRRRTALVGAALIGALVTGAIVLHAHGRDDPPARIDPVSAKAIRTRPRAVVTRTLTSKRVGRLDAPLQDAAAVSLDASHAMLLGGLTAADTSTDAVSVISRNGERAAGRLPTAVHDAAAATLGGSVYLFGGGDGVSQHGEIVHVGRGVVGRLPAPSSDQAAAVIGSTAYVVGGFTGTHWLDTVVAWSPGRSARIVAHLPSPVRYAAVTSAGGKLIVAGGSLPDGEASSRVYEYSPSSGVLRPLGRLPQPTTHAAAAELGGFAYVIGGRGANLDTPTSRIEAIDPHTGRVRGAGHLRQPLSDASAISLGSGILVAGGRGANGTQSSVLVLSPATRARAVSALDVYAADGPNMFRRATRRALPRVYVPNSDSNTVDVIDPRRMKIVQQFPVGALPQHVTPSWDLKTLYVLNDEGNSITPIDPRTAQPGRPIPVADPYNMYFTPDGRFAIVVAERLGRLDFSDPHTFRLVHALAVPCRGVDHMDFSAHGGYLLASCEFSGQLIKVDVRRQRVVGTLQLPGAAMPQDVKLAPDGKIFYVADMHANGLWEIDSRRLRVIGFLPTGLGVHGLYPSRNGKLLYATNRGAGTISVISFRTRRVVATWRIPGGSPDMGNVSADGKVLWLSGRWNGVVYAIDTRNGRLLAKIPVGSSPHGLCVWPQPGRYSLGHTGILR